MNRHFFATTRPYRKDFVINVTEEENDIMKEHFQYLKSLQNQGKLYLAGPAGFPSDPFGVYIFIANSEEEAQKLVENDPSVLAKIQSVEIVKEIKLSLTPFTKHE